MGFLKRIFSGSDDAQSEKKEPSGGCYTGSPDKAIKPDAKPDDATPHNGVSYADIKKKLLEDGKLFEDPDFLCADESIFFSKKVPVQIEWKRPSEIVENPCLFVGGASRFDIAQGMLGDCWLLAAVAALCQYDGLLHQVVPPEQSFEEEYCGIFRFRFWQYGRWEEVVVDDRLPTCNNKLVFLHSPEKNEFWAALLEKAYAKICANYEALKGGQTSEAMEDFTGGVTETFDLRKPEDGENFFRLMLKAQARQSLMCCSIEAKPNEIEAKCDNGLIKGHAYSITSIKKINPVGSDEDLELVRVRNPWGNEREWTGDWSDGSDQWNQLSDEEKEEVGLIYDDDGEFWMSFEDFKSNFTKVEICMLSPDSAGDLSAKRWEMQIFQGSWQKFISAGGCRNFPTMFHINPQYCITLEDPDDDEDVDNCTIVLGLIQKGRRKERKSGLKNLTMGFAIYQLGEDADGFKEQGRLNNEFFLKHKTFARSASFSTSREITGRFSLPPGSYVVIPSTYKPNEEGDFILRMFSEKAHQSACIDTTTDIVVDPREYTDEEDSAFNERFMPFFERVAGEDDEIDAFELQSVLNRVFQEEMDGKNFSLEACRSMLSMVDQDVRNGKLDFEEFRELWRTMTDWKNTFNEFDRDGSDDMSATELRVALCKLGFKLSTCALSSVSLRYANKQGRVSMDDFIQICCRVLSTYESFLSFGGQPFSLDAFLMSSIYT